MSVNRQPFSQIAVLGAGVMGAQIAAHCVNAGINCYLFDITADTDDNKNANIQQAIKRLTQLKPPPLASNHDVIHITAANYTQDLAQLNACDLIIEAVSEQLAIKQHVYEMIAEFIHENAIVVSNTSGLSLQHLAQLLPDTVQPRFCGVHFFNPPRYMPLVELIPQQKTDNKLLDRLETFLVSYLGKSVIRAKDTPNFIANRIGVFSLLAILQHAETFGLNIATVDQLTGSLLKRPTSATYRTLDIVGLDTFSQVVENLKVALPNDPWLGVYQLPAWIKVLIEQGHLGQKTQRGIYQRINGENLVFDKLQHEYHACDAVVHKEIKAILALESPVEKFIALHDSVEPQAQFLWAYFRDLFHYCAVNLVTIADNVRDIDLAMCWGFAWQEGPFELWQAAGWLQIVDWIKADIQSGKSLAQVALPEWVYDEAAQHIYHEKGAYAPQEKAYQQASGLAVYQRHCLFDKRWGKQDSDMLHTLLETEHILLWSQADDLPILSFKTKNNQLNQHVIQDINQAITWVEDNFSGLIIWQMHGEDFSLGADIEDLMGCVDQQADIDTLIKNYQQTFSRIRYAKIPVVAAIKGRVLGSACELVLHCDRIVAGLDTFMGLIEASLGLLPSGGGLKTLLYRAMQTNDVLQAEKNLTKYFQQIMMSTVSSSAKQAREMGLLRETDLIVMDSHALLYHAKQQLKALQANAYQPPLRQNIPVLGKAGIANLQMALINRREGGLISEHDYFIGKQLATVLCGGDVDNGGLSDETHLLRLEREALKTLLQTEKTQARIRHTLKVGKTGEKLRN